MNEHEMLKAIFDLLGAIAYRQYGEVPLVKISTKHGEYNVRPDYEFVLWDNPSDWVEVTDGN